MKREVKAPESVFLSFALGVRTVERGGDSEKRPVSRKAVRSRKNAIMPCWSVETMGVNFCDRA